jgi:hypothetical protein
MYWLRVLEVMDLGVSIVSVLCRITVMMCASSDIGEVRCVCVCVEWLGWSDCTGCAHVDERRTG